MSAATDPFTRIPHIIGGDAIGNTLRLLPMTTVLAALLAPAIAAIGPWAHYGATEDTLSARLCTADDGAVSYAIECGGTPAGVVIIRSPWLAGPYLQMLAILPAFQGRSIGAAVLSWYEAAAQSAHQRQVWLCVSSFNVHAQRFYQRHGYTLTTTLPDLMRDGDDEMLMRKRLINRSLNEAPSIAVS